MTASVPAPTTIDAQLLQAQLAHLAALQTIIARLAGYSATVKNFALTVSAGLIGLAWGKHGAALLLLAGFSFATVFMCLDAYYLALERSFRAAHTKVCARGLDRALDQCIKADALGWSDFLRATSSISVWPFYSPLLLTFMLLTLLGSHA